MTLVYNRYDLYQKFLNHAGYTALRRGMNLMLVRQRC